MSYHSPVELEPASPATPPTMTPPPTFTLPHTAHVSSELDVTLQSPSPPPQLSHTPPQLNSSPPPRSFSSTPVRSSPEQDDITAHVVRHESPPSNQDPVVPLGAESEATSEEERGSQLQRRESWGSLPQQEGGGGDGEDIEEHNSGDKGLSEVVGSKVDQLTKMVEKLSAKFVLLETRLKLSQAELVERSSPGRDPCFKSRESGEGEREERRKLRDITGDLNHPESSAAKPADMTPSLSLRLDDVATPPPLSTETRREVATPPPSSTTTRRDYVHRYSSSHITHRVIASPSTVRQQVMHMSVYL